MCSCPSKDEDEEEEEEEEEEEKEKEKEKDDDKDSFIQKKNRRGRDDDESDFPSCIHKSRVSAQNSSNGTVVARPNLGDMFECDKGKTKQKEDEEDEIFDVLSSKEGICDWLKSISYCRNAHSCLTS